MSGNYSAYDMFLVTKTGSLLHDPAAGARSFHDRCQPTLDEPKQPLDCYPGVEQPNHLLDGESGLFSCNSELGYAALKRRRAHIPPYSFSKASETRLGSL